MGGIKWEWSEVDCSSCWRGEGWEDGADLISKSKTTLLTHDEIHTDYFMEWFTEQFCQTYHNWVIILDNVTYHNRQQS